MSLTACAVALMIGCGAPEAGSFLQVEPAALAEPQPDSALQASPAAMASPTDPASTGEPAPAAAPAPAEGSVIGTTVSPTQGDDIVVMRRQPPPPGDPLERLNTKSFETVQSVDKAVIEPVAKVYNKGLPRPVRKGLRNFFSNLNEPVVFAAYLLQFKPGKAVETAGRFAINTTIGIGGFVDMAKRKPFNLPYRPNGLANVLGYYGVGPGPYMYLPIIGPTTVRDLVGDTIDKMLVPAVVGKPFTEPAVVIPATILGQLGERAAFDEEIGRIREEGNPYAAYRELYLKQRKAEIEALHGRTTPDVVPVYGRAMPMAGKSEGQGATAPESSPAPTPAVPF